MKKETEVALVGAKEQTDANRPKARLASCETTKKNGEKKRQRTGRVMTRPVPKIWSVVNRKCPSGLLEFDRGSGGLELLLDFLGVGLGSSFLDGLRGAFDEILGFLEAQAGDGADFLDDADLVRAGC